MSREVAAAFAAYFSRIELNPARAQLASERYNAVKTAIEAASPDLKVRQIGSFQRKTKIRPRSLGDGLDVDALVVLGEARTYSSDGTGTTPVAAQDRVFRALTASKIYRVMRPVKDAPTVMLEYEDRDGFTIELVPAFVELTGKYPRPGGPPCYIIAGANGQWIPADYDYDAAVITGLNRSPAVQGTLVPMIKLAKMFFRTMQLEWKSFHIEVLAATLLPRILESWEARGLTWDYPEAFGALLQLLPNAMTNAAALPGSFSPPVVSGIEPGLLDRAAAYVRNRADAARQNLESADAEALVAWREFFKDAFPASYGSRP